MELNEKKIKSLYFKTMKRVKQQDKKSGIKSRFSDDELNTFIDVPGIKEIARKYSEDDVQSAKGPVYSSHVESLNSLREIVDEIEEGLCESLHFRLHLLKGHLGPIGSSKDGTKIGKPDEFDRLYDVHLPEKWRAKESGEMGCYEIYDDQSKIVSPRDVFSELADSIDCICSEMILPSNIKFGGFASGSYSGCRINGPAVTLLFEMEDGHDWIPFSYDITLAFNIKKSDLIRSINKKLKVIQSQVQNRVISKAKIHLVPEMIENKWLISTAETEAQIICELGENAPVTNAIKTAKMIGKDIEGCVAEKIRASKLINPPEISYQMQEILENYQKMEKNVEHLKSLWRVLRYGHIFLEESVAREHNELTKSVISVNNACLKHSILAMAWSTENSFSRPANGINLDKLIIGAFKNIGDGSKTSIPHAFLDNLQISASSVSGITAMVKDTQSLKTIFRKHCQHFVECSQNPEILEKPRQKALKRKSSEPEKNETKKIMRSQAMSQDFVDNSSVEIMENNGNVQQNEVQEDKTECETDPDMEETVQHALSCNTGQTCTFSARVIEKGNPFLVNHYRYFIVTFSDKHNSASIRINVQRNIYDRVKQNESYRFSGVLRVDSMIPDYDFISGTDFKIGRVRQIDVVGKFAELDQWRVYDPDGERTLNEALHCPTTSIIKGKIIKKGSLKMTRRGFLRMYLCLRDSDIELPVIFSWFPRSCDEYNLYDVGDVIQVSEARRYQAYWDKDLITLNCPSNWNIEKLERSSLHELPISNIDELGWNLGSYFNVEGQLQKYKIVSFISAQVYKRCPEKACENTKLDEGGRCPKCKKTSPTYDPQYAYARIEVQTHEKKSTSITVTLFLEDIIKCCPDVAKFRTSLTNGKLEESIVACIPFYCRASLYKSDSGDSCVFQVYDVVD